MAQVQSVATLLLCVCIESILCTISGNSSQALSGERLRCFECTESFKKSYSYDTSCQRRPEEVDTRSCGASDRYCQVKRIERFGQTISIERGCVASCYYGCRVDKFGLTTLTCISCCQGLNCNTDNGGHALVAAMPIHTYLSFIALLTITNF
ncbi:uncharacterized protein [Watersipora subatra]|uniref:uncharacterized protein n=1 Tax=Watersipora subatra TaxID=2589382 RepID=UPI00355AFA73